MTTHLHLECAEIYLHSPIHTRTEDPCYAAGVGGQLQHPRKQVKLNITVLEALNYTDNFAFYQRETMPHNHNTPMSS
jgi:hypothetical protein